MADEEIIVDYEEEDLLLKVEEPYVTEEENETDNKTESSSSETAKEAVLPESDGPHLNHSKEDQVDAGSVGGKKKPVESGSNSTVSTKNNNAERRREKRHRIQGMFDITNMSYEQYVEKHYTLLYEEWFANNSFPNPHFYPMQPPAAQAAIMQPPAYVKSTL